MKLFNFNIFENILVFLSPELFILYFIILSLSFFLYIYSVKSFFFPKLLKGAFILSLFVVIILFNLVLNFLNIEFIILNNHFIVNNYCLLFKLLILFAFFLFLLISFFYFIDENSIVYEYTLVLWLSFLSLFVLISSNDFLLLFLALELQGLSAYVLTTAKIKSNYSTEAGLKYFTLNSYATGLALFGISLLYGITGTTNFTDLQEFFALDVLNTSMFNIACVSILLIMTSLFFKLTAAPFHFWAVDVYEGSPSGTMFFFFIVPKIAILQLLFNLTLGIFFPFSEIILYFFLISIIASVIVGAFGALFELKVKRLLVYSGISNVGFLLINYFLFAFYGIEALFFYLIIYIIVQCSFFIVFFVVKRYNFDNSFSKIKYIEDFISLVFANPLLAFILTVSIFSLSGIPPLAGFFTKLLVFFNIIKSNLLLFAFILIFLNFASYIYYVRFIRTIILDNFFGSYNWHFFKPLAWVSCYLIFIFFVLNLIFFIFGLSLLSVLKFFLIYACII
jgi:NADH-quinone oxidoreductase subunit N